MSQYWLSNGQITQQDGTPTREFLEWLNRLVDQLGGQGRDSIAEIASGDKVIRANVEGVGDLVAALSAQNANIEQAQTSSGGIVITASPSSLLGTYSAGTVVSATGGTEPYSWDWDDVAGSAFIAIDDNESASPTFSMPTSVTSQQVATWKVTVTDSLSATSTKTISITLTPSEQLLGAQNAPGQKLA